MARALEKVAFVKHYNESVSNKLGGFFYNIRVYKFYIDLSSFVLCSKSEKAMTIDLFTALQTRTVSKAQWIWNEHYKFL